MSAEQPRATDRSAPAEPLSDLPPYPGIALRDVQLVHALADLQAAHAVLMAADAIGFDTESKPTFHKGESSTGPHLIQFATDTAAYLIQIGERTAPELLVLIRDIMESTRPLKVGFGLSDDVKRLHAKLGIVSAQVLDLSVALREPGQKNDLGAKTAVAKFFGQALQKSKKISTTNWALPRLNEKQILYAADDAQVALRVYRHWIAQGGKMPTLRPFKVPKAKLLQP